MLRIIINLGDVFKGVKRPTAIVVFDKKKSTRNIITISNITKLKGAEKQIAINTKSNFSTVAQKKLSKIFNALFVTSNPEHYTILETLEKAPHLKLSDVVDEDGIQRGVSPDLKKAFLIDKATVAKYKLEKEKIKPVLTGGKEVKRYYINNKRHKFLIYTCRNEDFSKLPNICKFIEQFKDEITCKEVKQKKHPLYALHRPRKEKIFLKSKKILGVITEDEIIVSIDENEYYATDGLYIFGLKDGVNLNYIMGILNSRLLIFVYRLLTMEKSRILAQVKPTMLVRLPIRTIDERNQSDKTSHDKIVYLVNQMLGAKKNLAAAKMDKDINYYQRKCSNTDREINNEVYKLYGLSKDEIEIINNEL